MLTQRPPQTPDTAVEPARSSTAELVRRPLMERIDVRVAVAVGVAWSALTAIAVALEPAAQGSEPAIGVVLSVAMDVIFLTMLFGLALRRRWGLVASLVGAAVVTAMAVACPTSGHHQFGAWWFGQMACVGALVVGSVYALRLPAPAAQPADH